MLLVINLKKYYTLPKFFLIYPITLPSPPLNENIFFRYSRISQLRASERSFSFKFFLFLLSFFLLVFFSLCFPLQSWRKFCMCRCHLVYINLYDNVNHSRVWNAWWFVSLERGIRPVEGNKDIDSVLVSGRREDHWFRMHQSIAQLISITGWASSKLAVTSHIVKGA